jgi:hypothetical protein
MAGFKRGAFRGGSGGAFKKGSAKKRAGSDDEDSALRASKKPKGDDEEESAPVMPELKTDDDGKQYVGVSARRSVQIRNTSNIHEAQYKRQTTHNRQRIQGQSTD